MAGESVLEISARMAERYAPLEIARVGYESPESPRWRISWVGADGRRHTTEAKHLHTALTWVGTEGESRRHAVQEDVEAFHREVCEIEDSTVPEIRRPELRAGLIAEEAAETITALTGKECRVILDDEETIASTGVEAPDLVAVADGLCDLLAVVYGTFAECGLDAAPLWEEVHRTNMAKKGPVRPDGKRMKPEGWVPPQLEPIIEVQRRRAGA